MGDLTEMPKEEVDEEEEEIVEVILTGRAIEKSERRRRARENVTDLLHWGLDCVEDDDEEANVEMLDFLILYAGGEIDKDNKNEEVDDEPDQIRRLIENQNKQMSLNGWIWQEKREKKEMSMGERNSRNPTKAKQTSILGWLETKTNPFPFSNLLPEGEYCLPDCESVGERRDEIKICEVRSGIDGRAETDRNLEEESGRPVVPSGGLKGDGRGNDWQSVLPGVEGEEGNLPVQFVLPEMEMQSVLLNEMRYYPEKSVLPGREGNQQSVLLVDPERILLEQTVLLSESKKVGKEIILGNNMSRKPSEFQERMERLRNKIIAQMAIEDILEMVHEVEESRREARREKARMRREEDRKRRISNMVRTLMEEVIAEGILKSERFKMPMMRREILMLESRTRMIMDTTEVYNFVQFHLNITTCSMCINLAFDKKWKELV